MKEYDEATLKKVQQTEMEILRDFILHGLVMPDQESGQ